MSHMTVEERIISKINYEGTLKPNMDSKCHEWTAYKNNYNYGQIKINKKSVGAHRLAYQLWVGPIPADKPQVNHHCDNPPCVNPEHLYAGTAKENMKDRDVRGRNHESKKTHCKNGHKFNQANTRIDKNNVRHCRECGNIRSKAFYVRTAPKLADGKLI